MALKTTDNDGADGAIIAEINITPLVDIFLVLLIIFMVTSSVLSQVGVDVTLPKASQKTSQTQPEGVIVTLLPGGKMKIQHQEISAGDFVALEKILKAALNKTPSKLVILEGDRQAYLGSAIELMDHAKKAGADKFAIATTTSDKTP